MYCEVERVSGTIEAEEWAARNLDEYEMKLLQREIEKNEQEVEVE